MNNIMNFNDLFSQIRLSSYDNNIIKHYDNLKLVGKITPKIATLEISNKTLKKTKRIYNATKKNFSLCSI